MKSTRVFGNTLATLRDAAILGVILALVVAVAAYFIVPSQKGDAARALDCAIVGASIFAALAIAVLPTCLFTIRVDEANISHVLAGGFVLSSKPVADLTTVDILGAFGATFTFAMKPRFTFWEREKNCCSKCPRTCIGDARALWSCSSAVGDPIYSNWTTKVSRLTDRRGARVGNKVPSPNCRVRGR